VTGVVAHKIVNDPSTSRPLSTPTTVRAAVARTGDVDDVQIMGLDDAIQVRVDEVQAWRRAPVPEQARLDVRERERFFE